jgi:hypothetical protein
MLGFEFHDASFSSFPIHSARSSALLAARNEALIEIIAQTFLPTFRLDSRTIDASYWFARSQSRTTRLPKAAKHRSAWTIAIRSGGLVGKGREDLLYVKDFPFL